MPHRYSDTATLSSSSSQKIEWFHALRERLREGYRLSDLRSDALAGIVVGLVAIPLGMALAIAIGAAPQHGLYTVIFAGFFAALLGGSRYQVSGPTAAFVVVLAPIVHKFGIPGLLTVGFLSGILLTLMGYMRFGQLIQYIPYPVTTGFTAGIAVVIATLQFKDFFGLQTAALPESYLRKVETLIAARGTFSVTEFAIGLTTLGLLLLWPRVNKKIPPPLIALSAVTVGALLLQRLIPELHFATIGNRFSTWIDGELVAGVPNIFPPIEWPWEVRSNVIDGATPSFSMNFATLKALMPSVFVVALLGAIESLLSAVIADGMTQTRHNPDTELVALGVSNMVCPFFGGIPATGAIARTATNIRFGAVSPVASMTHAAFTLFAMLVAAPYVSHIPMAALAALLLVVAYNMSEIKHFAHIVRVAPGSDVSVLLICFILTVAIDMVAGVTAGVGLAALLFIRRMSQLTSAQLLNPSAPDTGLLKTLPSGVLLYRIEGPLFFGAASKAMEAIQRTSPQVKLVILDLDRVPVMDVTGLVALESVAKQLKLSGKRAILARARRQPMTLIQTSEALRESDSIHHAPTLDDAAGFAARQEKN